MKSDQPIGTHLALGTVSFAVCFAAWGLDQRLRAALPRAVRAQRHADGVPGRRPRPARVAGAPADRHAHRPIRRPPGVRRAHDRGRDSRRARSRRRQLRPLLAVAFFLGPRGLVLRRRRRLRLAMDAAGAAGDARSASTASATSGSRRRSSSGPLLAAALGPAAVFRRSAALLVAWGVVFALRRARRPARTPPGSSPPWACSAARSWRGRWPPSTS